MFHAVKHAHDVHGDDAVKVLGFCLVDGGEASRNTGIVDSRYLLADF